MSRESFTNDISEMMYLEPMKVNTLAALFLQLGFNCQNGLIEMIFLMGRGTDD